MTRESAVIALRGLLASKLRTFLTVLGILIGVGSVILLVAVGTGTAKESEAQLRSLGTNTLTVLSGGAFGPRAGTSTQRVDLTKRDAESLVDPARAPSVAAVVPAVNAQARGVYEGKSHQPAQFTGTTANYSTVRNALPASGSFFTDDDVTQRRKVIVIGPTVAETLFEDADPIGQRVKFGSATWTVIGVLKERGSNGFQDQDDVVLAPITAVQDALTGNTGTYSNLTVQAKSAELATTAQAEVLSILNANHKIVGPSPFQVLNQASLLETQEEQNRLFTVLLGAVAAISLLVGGIGVMNIMLVTVTERTREIGIRKAIGAQRSHIVAQFLVESVLLTVLGGLLGVAAGLIGSQFEILGVQPVVEPYSVLLAFGVAVAVGVGFGLYPANRAAGLDPIDALRHQ